MYQDIENLAFRNATNTRHTDRKRITILEPFHQNCLRRIFHNSFTPDTRELELSRSKYIIYRNEKSIKLSWLKVTNQRESTI